MQSDLEIIEEQNLHFMHTFRDDCCNPWRVGGGGGEGGQNIETYRQSSSKINRLGLFFEGKRGSIFLATPP